MQEEFHFSGNTFDYDRDYERLGKQMRAVMDFTVMRANIFHTFEQIRYGIVASGGKRYPDASISARLRDLRNKYGFRVDCRYVKDGLHEYAVII